MPSSSPTRLPSAWAAALQSSIVTPATGTNGQTSVAPMRGCSPWCLDMSMSSPAFLIRRKAASTMVSGGPTKVITVRWVELPGSTSNRRTPSTVSTTAAMASILARSRPSLMLGTHSMSRLVMVADLRPPNYCVFQSQALPHWDNNVNRSGAPICPSPLMSLAH